jgi:ATP-dependent DNA helicase 2 subunit 2
MPDRAGYQVSVYAIDVSTSMGEVFDDPTGGSSSSKKKTKLDYVKEFVARKCEPKVRSSYSSQSAPILDLDYEWEKDRAYRHAFFRRP